MSAGRICVREVDLADPGETARAAARRMQERRVGSLVVLDGARKPAGIVTDRDLVTRVLAAGKDPDRTRVAEVMTPTLRTVSEDTPIESALALMRSARVRRLPVVDHAGALVGVVSLDDVLTLLAEELTLVGNLLTRQGPQPAVLV